jgi:hypothetical protein
MQASQLNGSELKAHIERTGTPHITTNLDLEGDVLDGTIAKSIILNAGTSFFARTDVLGGGPQLTSNSGLLLALSIPWILPLR